MSSVVSAAETAAGSQLHGVRWAPIIKPYRPWRVEPNLADYDGACAAFSWETARRALDGLPGVAASTSRTKRSIGTLWERGVMRSLFDGSDAEANASRPRTPISGGRRVVLRMSSGVLAWERAVWLRRCSGGRPHCMCRPLEP